MERSEPSLIPEWLRSSGSVSGGGSSAHHLVSSSSSSQSDVSSSAHHTRNRNSRSTSDFDSPHSAFLDRSSSSNSRRSSSNGSAKHAYSSFSKSHRDKDRERDRDRLSFGDHWDRDYSDSLGSILSSRIEKDKLRRSHSMVSRNRSEILPRRVAGDVKNGNGSNHANGNGLISGGSNGSSTQKAVFEKDFPSLGSEERQGVPDIGRIPSPVLSTGMQSFYVGSSALIGVDGRTSVLAEVPTMIGSSSMGSSSSVQTVSASASGAPGSISGLNMAEALTQAPSRTPTAPQLNIQTNRLEELAIKQSRQLIPVTPSMPKSSVLNSSDKSKNKTLVRPGEMNLAAKSVQQQPSPLHPANQSHIGGHLKSDAPKASHGKLLVLKPGWENGVSLSAKDVASPTNNPSRASNNQPTTHPSVSSAPLRTPKNPKLSTGERKSGSLNLISGLSVEKKPSLSQTQSRNDFFNRLKEKNSMNASAVISDSASVVSSSTDEKPCEVKKEVVCAPDTQAIKNGVELSSSDGAFEEVQRISEEEAAFLRSLGWEENSGEPAFITEEEINAFIQQCMILRPDMQQKLLESHATSLGGGSSELSCSDSGSEP